MVPVLLLFAAAGIVQVIGLAWQRKTRELLSYGALIVAAGAALRVNLGNEENPRATAYYNLAVSLEHGGKADRAEANYVSAINAKPDFVQAHVNLGGLLARRGDFEAAIVEERTALSLRENDAIAHTDLANALFELGRLDEAELHYRRAVRIEPDLAEAKSGLSALSEARKQLAR
jgi:tetratricopeptide (TPR) repeat protein